MEPAPSTPTCARTALRRRAGLGVGVVALLALGASTVYRAGLGPKERTDLPVYLAASARLLESQDPVGAQSSRGWPYYYPPTLAALLVPLVPLPLPVAAAAWFVVGVAACVAGAAAARRVVVTDDRTWDRWDALAVALVAIPAFSALLRGQLGPALLGLCGGAMLLLARGRDVTAGMLLALAASLKVTPGLLLLGLPLARRWRATAAAGAGLALWLVVLPAPFLGADGALRACARAAGVVGGLAAAPTRVEVGEVQRLDPHIPTNQSLASQALRRLPAGPPRVAVVWLLGALTLGASLPLCARGATSAGLALLLAAPLVAAPIAWHHHHVVLLPALLLLAARARDGDRAARAALAAFAALSLLHFAVPALRPLGLLGLGTAVVFAVLAARAWTAPRGSGAGALRP